MDLESLPPADKRRLLGELLAARAAGPREAPLSRGQERLWLHQELEPANPVYNIALAHALRGPVDPDALADAVKATVARHGALRTTFRTAGREPVQVVAPEPVVGLERVTAGDPAEADRLVRAAASAPFDLRAGPPARFRLVAEPDGAHTLVVVVHHIVADRWSLGLIADDVSAAYAARVAGGSPPMSGPAGSFADYAAWERTALTPEALPDQVADWRAALGAGLRAVELPGAAKSSGAPGFAGDRTEFALDPDLTAAVKALATAADATLYAALLAGWAEALHRLTGQDDLLLASPVAGRHRPRSRGVVGYFNNVVPLRVDRSGRPTPRELVGRAQAAARDAFARQDLPFQDIAALPEAARVSLARCLFSLQNTPGLALRLPGVEADYRDVFPGGVNFDLAVFLEERGGGLLGLVDARRGRVGADDVGRVVAAFRAALREMADAPGRPLPVVPPVNPADAAPAVVPTGADPPRNELERRLVLLWEEAVGVSPVGPTANFFDLGGESLAAARMMSRVEETVGRALPLALLLEAPTPRALAVKLADRGWEPAWSSLVPIKAGGGGRPFFCVHGGGGGVLSYRALADHLGPDRPVWGLQAHGHDRADGPRAGVADMARTYLAAVRAEQPAGPYLLGGHSFGALVAFEMAQQLVAAGEEVALLAVLDYPGPGAKVTRWDKLRWHRIVLAQLDWRDRLGYVGTNLRRRLVRSRVVPRRVKLYLKGAGAGVGRSTTRWRLDMFERNLAAITAYKVGPYPGRLTLFRARLGAPAIHADPAGGWGGVAGGGVEVYDVGGRHMEMFREPFVRGLGAALRGCLDRADPPAEG